MLSLCISACVCVCAVSAAVSLSGESSRSTYTSTGSEAINRPINLYLSCCAKNSNQRSILFCSNAVYGRFNVLATHAAVVQGIERATVTSRPPKALYVPVGPYYKVWYVGLFKA